MREYDLFLTDLDCTIVDTRVFIYEAFSAAIAKHTGIEISYEQFTPAFGKPPRPILETFTGLTDVEALFDEVKLFQAANLHLIKPIHGSIQALKKLRAAGVKIAGITSRSQNTKDVLERARISDLFDYVVTGDDVQHHKPDPEPLNKALAFLAVTPSRAIMMGDAMDDILAGKNAGVKTIGVTYGPSGEEIRKYKPDFVIDKIAQAVPIILGKA